MSKELEKIELEIEKERLISGALVFREDGLTVDLPT